MSTGLHEVEACALCERRQMEGKNDLLLLRTERQDRLTQRKTDRERKRKVVSMRK